MFDIGWSEMAVVALVALIVIGPKDLPRVARNVGQWVAKGRAMGREFHRALEDMAREAELDKVKSEIEKAGRTDLGKTIEKTIDPSGELSKALEPPVLGGQPAAAPATLAIAPAPPEQPASGLATGAPTEPAAAAVTSGRPQSSAATGAPTQPPAPAVAPAAPATSEASAAAGNGAGAATPRKRTRRAAAPMATAGPEPSAPAGNGTEAADERKRPRRATAPTEPS